MNRILLILACLLFGSAGFAQVRPHRGRVAPAEPTYRSNLPTERKAVAPAQEEVAVLSEPPASKPEGEQNGFEKFWELWKKQVNQYVEKDFVELVLFAPAWFPGFVILFIIWRRQRFWHRPSTTSAKTEEEKGPQPLRRSAKKTSKKEEPGKPIELNWAHDLFLVRPKKGPSIYDNFVGLAPNMDAIRSFRRMALEHLDAVKWEATIRDGKAERFKLFWEAWIKDVGMERVATWLGQHPLIQEQRLRVQVPSSLDGREIDSLTLTEADGLGAPLSVEQKELLDQARKTMAALIAQVEKPLPLLSVSSTSGLAALLPKSDGELSDPLQNAYGLCLLLGGMTVLDQGNTLGLHKPIIALEFRDAMAEHERMVGSTVIGEGMAVHMLYWLGGISLEGIGILLASMSGAAFSPSTTVLRISKRIGEIKDTYALDALARLGELVLPLITDDSSEEGQAFSTNLRWITGEERLDRAVKHAQALSKEYEKRFGKDPLWKSGPKSPTLPDVAIIELHENKVKQAFSEAKLARERLQDILTKLGHAGASANEQLNGKRRLGYAMAGLGMPLLRSLGMEILSAGREAISALKIGE